MAVNNPIISANALAPTDNFDKLAAQMQAQLATLEANLESRNQALQMVEAGLKEYRQEADVMRRALDEHSVVIITDNTGVIRYLNDNFTRLSGYTQDEIIGRSFQEMLILSDTNAVWLSMILSLSEGRIWKGQISNITKAGEQVWLDVSALPMMDEQRVLRQFVLVGTDISARKREEALQADRVLQMETVAAISAATTNILDLDQLLPEVSNLTCDRFDLYHAHIYLLDEVGQSLSLAGGAGEAGRTMKTQGYQIALDHPNSLVAKAGRKRQGVIVNDVRDTPDFLPNPLLPETRAEMSIPMIVGDTLVGVLDVQATTTGRFTDDDVRVQTVLASQIGVAVQNARQFRAAQDAGRLAETLASINSGLSRAQDIAQILAAIDTYTSTLGANVISLSFVDGELDGQPQVARIVSSRRQGAPWLEDPLLGFDFVIRDIPFLHIWYDNPSEIAYYEGDAQDTRIDEVTRQTLVSIGIAAFAIIPMRTAERWIGYINVIWDAPHTFTDEERRVYQMLMLTAASVVASRRDFLDLQHATALAQTLATLNTELSRATDSEQILRAIALYTDPLRPASILLSFVDDEENGKPTHATPIASWRNGAPDRSDPALNTTLNLRELPFFDLWFANPDQINYLEDGLDDPRLNEDIRGLMRMLNFQSYAVIPLHTANQWEGFISITWEQPRKFSADERAVFSGISQTASAVVASQRAYAQLQRANNLSLTLAVLNTELSRATNIEQTLAVIAQYADNTQSTSIVFSMVDEERNGMPASATTTTVWRNGALDLDDPTLNMRLDIEQLPFNEVWLANPDQITYSENIENDTQLDATLSQLMRSFNIYAYAVLPLRVGAQWVGFITVTWSAPHLFTAEERAVYNGIWQTAAAVIATQRAYLLSRQAEQIARRQAEQLEAVAAISATISTQQEVEALLTNVAGLTKSRFNLYHAHIYLLEDDDLVLAAGAGETGQLMKSLGHQIPLRREVSLVARAARNREAVIINDITQAADYLPNPLLPLTRAEMALPIIAGHQVLGVLDVQSEQVGRFTSGDQQVMTTLAAQIAIALENARGVQQLVEAANRLREVDRLKSQFLANMSHELRTPLNSIIGYSEVLLDGDDGELGDEAHEDIGIIHSSGRHLLSLINDILDLARIEAGEMRIETRDIDLQKLIAQVVQTAQVLLKDKPVELRVVETTAIPPLHGDPLRMKQILMNLVSNAIKFTDRGSITLRTSLVSSDAGTPMAVIDVEDTGIGIPEEHLGTIFEQFRQVDGSSTRRAGGTGLGLTITRHLVQMQGGDVTVESDYGVGSTFHVTLPLPVMATAQ